MEEENPVDQIRNEQIEKYLASQRDNIVEDLFTLARIPSVRGEAAPDKPYGEEVARALDAALAQCEREGMQTENLGYRCGSALWRAEGAGEKELALVAHLDVVPAGDGWSGKPFEPFLRDGYAIARGVRDNKNAAIAGLYTVRCIKELGFPMKHSLRVIFGCAEETGMDDLPYYAKAHEGNMPVFSIVPDTAFPVCHGEKGIYRGDFLLEVGEDLRAFCGGIALNVVADKASAVLNTPDGEVAVSAQGISCHASRPQGSKNAIRELAAVLLESYPLSEKTKQAMTFVRDMLSDWYGEHLGVAFEDEPSGKLTCISGIAKLEGGKLRLCLDIRYPVTHSGKLITEGLERCAKAAGAGFEVHEDDAPSFIPKDNPAIERLTRIYAEVTGERREAYVMGGGTYARHLPNAVAFGMDFPDEHIPCPDGHGDCHEPDECQSIRGLMEAVRIYVHALLELDEAMD